MTGRSGVNCESIIKRDFFIPIFFNNTIFIKPPIFEMLAHAQSTNNSSYLSLQCHESFVISMVPMVVRNKEIVYFWNIFWSVRIATFEGFYHKRKWRS